ncbi:MAG: LAGLIDADG family homing endonuclease [Candidatus Omnitrophota bacterium]
MSRIVAQSAIRGAKKLVQEAEGLLGKAIEEKGKEQILEFPETAFFMPMANALLGAEVKTLNEALPIIKEAKSLLHEDPTNDLWLPYLGSALDSGIAALLAEEIILAIRYIYGKEPQADCNGFFTDTILRTLGIQLVDGRMPGFAAILGAAPDNKTAVDIVRDFQKRNIMTFVGSSSNGKSIIDQLKEEKIEMGWDTYIVPYGRDTVSALYPLNWAIRGALTFGGIKAGNAKKCLMYCKERVFAFGLTLGEVDDVKYATGAGAINMGFPIIADTEIPEIRPTGICTYEHLVKELDHKKIVQSCIEVRGVKVKLSEIPIPVAYSAAFEGERVRREQMYAQFGGKFSHAFEYVRSKSLDEVEDDKIEVVGPEIDEMTEGGAYPLGIVVDVAGRKMQHDFEPILERQVHTFLNEAMGIFHMGQRSMCWMRISKDAQKKGFKLRHLGVILHAQFHDIYSKIVDKVQITIYTKKEDVDRIMPEAEKVYEERDERMAGMTDESIDTFYSCTLCQSFAPNHLCIIKPERLGLCGAYSWLDAKACYELNPSGPNQPIKKGECLDPVRGEWKNINDFIYKSSNKTLEKFHGYSIMSYPETSCCTGDTEVLIGGKIVKIGDFIDLHRGGEEYARFKAATLSGGKTVEEDIVAMQRFTAPEELIRIETKSGAELVLTKDHKVFVDRQEGEAQVRADEIRDEDRIVSLKRLNLKEELPEISEIFGGRLNEDISNEIINKDLFYILGLLASDGSICRVGRREYKINFINTEPALINKYKRLAKKLFPKKNCKARIKNKNLSTIKGRIINSQKVCYDCYSNNSVLGMIAEYFGIKVGIKGVWNLAQLINLPKDFIGSFLAGIFDGDGSIRLRRYYSKWDIPEAYLCIGDKKAASHLQMLLRRFGITSFVKKSNSVYKVTLYGTNLIKFLDIAPIVHPKKKKISERVKKLSKANKGPDRAQGEVLPFGVGKILAEIPETKTILSPSTLFYYRTFRSRPVLSNVNKVIDGLPNDKAQILKDAIDTDYFLDIVSKVRTIKNNGRFDYVYNLTLSDTHSYYANGMHIANCGCFECIIAILPEANGFMVVNREFPGLTPAGMKFSTLAGSVGGGNQTPGFMGVGRLYIISKKFISADGGLKRLVWMPKELKSALGDRLKKRCADLGMPDLFDKIADETNATESEALVKYLTEKGHPAITMEPLM